MADTAQPGPLADLGG